MLLQPGDHLRQPVEEPSAGIPTEEELLLREACLNVSGSGGEGDALRGLPSAPRAVFSPQVPSEKPAAEDQGVTSEVSVPLTNFNPEELNSGGGRVPSGPGKYEWIPLVRRAPRLRGAAAASASATAKADPVYAPEAAVEAFFQLLGQVALPEPALDARVLLEDQAVVTATFLALFKEEEEAKLFTPETRSEDGPGAVDEEAL